MSAARVLVVEDDPCIRDLVTMALSDEGYEVIAASDGAIALDFTREYPPDVILLDMQMPVMDGWTFARMYRQTCASCAPIVVITAATDARARAAEIEADDCLGKPFDLDALLDCVDRFAHVRR
ncbi:MAG: response regulator transcription factor [Chloroflexi bacterium]|nr:response regulator transcription factor [Chloroflexota bacterium]